MNTPQEQQRSCFNCRNESQGRCEWARDTESRHRACRFCPSWVSEAHAISSDMGTACSVWELREEPWEK